MLGVIAQTGWYLCRHSRKPRVFRSLTYPHNGQNDQIFCQLPTQSQKFLFERGATLELWKVPQEITGKTTNLWNEFLKEKCLQKKLLYRWDMVSCKFSPNMDKYLGQPFPLKNLLRGREGQPSIAMDYHNGKF